MITERTEIDKISQAIFLYLQVVCRARLKGRREALNEKRDSYDKVATDLYKLEFQLPEEVESLRAIEALLRSERSFDDEFERIMRMEGVRKLYVQVQESKLVEGIVERKLVVETKRLHQIVNDRRYDIGQKKIVIDVNAESPSPNNFSFTPGPYPGKYNHPHASELNPCFGTDTNSGFNAAITKLLADCLWVEAIHLTLTFLRLDDIPPAPRDGECIDYREEVEAEFSEEERAAAKEEFVKFYDAVGVKRYTILKNARIAEMKSSIERLRAEFARVRQNIKEIRTEITHIEGEVEKVMQEGSREGAEALASREAIREAKIEEGKLNILFTMNDKDFTLILTNEYPPMVRVSKENENLLKYMLGTQSKEFRHTIDLLRSGKLAEFFDVFHSTFRSHVKSRSDAAAAAEAAADSFTDIFE